MTVKAPKTPAEVKALGEWATRPELTPAERTAEYSRHRRDTEVKNASRVIEAAEKARREIRSDEQAAIDAHLHEAEVWNGRYADHTAAVEHSRNRAGVRREALTYRQEGEHSFFKDAWAAKLGDSRASERLDRHRREMDWELKRLNRQVEARESKRAEDLGFTFEKRVTPNRLPGQGGNFAPPAWLIEDWADVPHPQRVISSLCSRFVLPKGVQSVNLPRLTAGAEAQTTADASAAMDRDMTDAAVSSAVTTIAGNADIAIQLLEQSGSAQAHMDEVIWKDLATSYDSVLEREVTTGTGKGDELLGILTVTGIGAITTAETSTIKQFKALGETFASVSNKRFMPPTAWIMRGGRWAFLATSEDVDERPLFTPLDMETQNVSEPIGVLLGLPVYLSESLPKNLGVSAEQEVLVAIRAEDSYLWESEPALSVFESVLSGTLEARVQLRSYAAFTPHRYPQSIATLGGAGFKVTAGF
jgi:HK97 family phage major capsid protein